MSLVTSALSHMLVTSVLLGGLVKAKAIEYAVFLVSALWLLPAFRALNSFHHCVDTLLLSAVTACARWYLLGASFWRQH